MIKVQMIESNLAQQKTLYMGLKDMLKKWHQKEGMV